MNPPASDWAPTPEEFYSRMKMAQELNEKAETKYYDWVRQMIVVSTGSLTLLVALQSKYAPAYLAIQIPLWMCWVLLAISVCMASAILQRESESLKLLSRAILKPISETTTPSQTGSPVAFVDQTPREKAMRKYFPLVLACALANLVVFAILNAAIPPGKTQDRHHGIQQKEDLTVRPNPS